MASSGGGVMKISKLDLNTEAEEESKTIEDKSKNKSAGKSETTIDDDELKSLLEDDEPLDDVYIQLFKDCGFGVYMEVGIYTSSSSLILFSFICFIFNFL